MAARDGLRPMCPLVPAWGLAACGLELAAAGWPLPLLAALHLALALATWRLWAALGRPPLAAERAGWLALAVPFTGALAAWALAPRTPRHPGLPPEPQGEPQLTPAEAAPPPAPHLGAWELARVLRTGSLEARLAAVRALKALEGADGVRILRAMLNHADHQVVLLASLALAELEAEYETAIRRAREHGGLELAAILRRYAQSGLAPEASLANLWMEVEAKAVAPQERAAARLALGDPAGALAAAGEAPDTEMVRLEALFQLGRFTELEEVAGALAAPEGSPAALAAAYWSGADA